MHEHQVFHLMPDNLPRLGPETGCFLSHAFLLHGCHLSPASPTALTVLSADPVARMLGFSGLKARQLTSAACASLATSTPAWMRAHALLETCNMTGWRL